MKIVLALLGLLYALSPFDLIPDMAAGWGWLDDLFILWILWRFYLSKRGRAPGYGGYQGRDRSGPSPHDDAHQRTASGAQAQSSRDESKDPYTVLGLGRNASPQEIKSAYRRLAAKYHPDKVAHLGKDFQHLAEKRFKEIQEAYRQLGGG